MEIKRDAYLQQLIERKDNGMIKVITGIRRCGKSFLLFTIFKRYLLENGVDVDHIIEIALDGIENEELRDPKVCFKYIKDAMKDDGKYYLLLDEATGEKEYTMLWKQKQKSGFVRLVVIFCNNEDKGEHFMSTIRLCYSYFSSNMYD